MMLGDIFGERLDDKIAENGGYCVTSWAVIWSSLVERSAL